MIVKQRPSLFLDSETIRLRYEEGELLEFLDAEELPPILVDLLEKSQVCGVYVSMWVFSYLDFIFDVLFRYLYLHYAQSLSFN